MSDEQLSDEDQDAAAEWALCGQLSFCLLQSLLEVGVGVGELEPS